MYQNQVGRGAGSFSSQPSNGRGFAQPPGLMNAGRAQNISSLGEQTISGNYGARVPVGSSNQAPSSYSGSPSLSSRAVVPPPGAEPAPYISPVAQRYIPGGVQGNSGPRVPVGSQGSASAPAPLQPPSGSVQSPYGSRTCGW